MPGLTSLFSSKLVGDLIACGAGGGRGGGLDSFGTLRVALGGVFEGEAACASAIEIQRAVFARRARSHSQRKSATTEFRDVKLLNRSRDAQDRRGGVLP